MTTPHFADQLAKCHAAGPDPTSVVLARMAGDLIEISVGNENASPKLVVYTTSEPMTREAVEALRRSYPTELIQVSPAKTGGPSVLHVVQDIRSFGRQSKPDVPGTTEIVGKTE